MARYENTKAISLDAGEAISIGRFVDVSAANTITMGDAGTDNIIGVSAEAVASGDTCPVAVGSGVVLIELGGTLAAGAIVECGTNGVAVASAGAGDIIGGVLLEGGASGDLVPMVLNIQRRFAA